MRYIVEITPKQAHTIQQYLEKGNYGSFSQFITTAIENQLALEENDIAGLRPYKPEEEMQKAPITNMVSKPNEFEKYCLKNIPDYNAAINSPGFKDLVFFSQEIPEHQAWIWGQVNKIFPVKVGVRILHQLLATKHSIELNEFLEIVAKEAAFIGGQIRNYETKNNKIRGEKVSPALPSSDEKSQNRYKFQFMVYQRKDGLLDGAMALMRFCNVYTEKKKQMIGITESGLKFSSIINPVLDNNDFEKSLSEEESQFYINHSKDNIKGEYIGMRWMLEKITDGNNNRESLNVEIDKTFAKFWKAVTPAVINTQRAGITARMFELGLIEKEKDGIYVKYRVSEIGKKVLFK